LKSPRTPIAWPMANLLRLPTWISSHLIWESQARVSHSAAWD